MSGALPAIRLPASIVVTSWAPKLISRTQNLKTQRRTRGGQRWILQCQYGPMEASTYADLWGFLDAQGTDAFTLTLPTGVWPQGLWTGTPAVNGAHASGSTSIAIDGLSAGLTAIGKRGDFVKFSGHSKVYQATADFNSNGSGQATLPITPRLHLALADNETITVSSVPFNVILQEDELPALSLQPPTQGTLSFKVIEDYE